MRSTTIRLIAALALIVAMLAMAPPSAKAQSVPQGGTNLQVSPAIVDTGAIPGQVTPVTVRLTNRDARPVEMRASVESLIEQAQWTPEEAAFLDASEWVTPAEPVFTLQPNQERAVTLNIAAPSAAEPGGHYANIIFAPTPGRPGTNTAATVQGRIAVPMLMTVPGNAVVELTYGGDVSFNRNAKDPNGKPASTLSVPVYNRGTLHTLAQVSFVVSDAQGNEQIMTANPVIILPKATQNISVPYNPGNGIGPRWVHAEFAYGLSSELLVSPTERFWLLPWFLLIPLVILVLGVSAFVAYRLTKKRKQQKATAAETVSEGV